MYMYGFQRCVTVIYTMIKMCIFDGPGKFVGYGRFASHERPIKGMHLCFFTAPLSYSYVLAVSDRTGTREYFTQHARTHMNRTHTQPESTARTLACACHAPHARARSWPRTFPEARHEATTVG